MYSVLAGKNPAVKKVYSFEPNQVIVPRLTNNLNINQIKTFEIIPAAISNQTVELSLHIVVGHTGKSTLRAVENANKTVSTVKSIQTINHEVLNKCIPVQPLNWIKIDVEGHEEVVIQNW